jgi:uncharacterized membrane protein
MTGLDLWLIRYGHVLGGTLWVGGYAVLVLALLPLMQKTRSEPLQQVAMTITRVMTYAGMATIFFGIVLITRTRGFASVGRGEWGLIIVVCIAIAVALLGIGDGMLRPALRKFTQTGDGRAARRAALIGLALTVIAIGLMTRALYASS